MNINILNPSPQRHAKFLLQNGRGVKPYTRDMVPSPTRDTLTHFWGGGASSLNYSRTQREIAHPTGTPKFGGNSGAACEIYSLNRGNDFTHAPARLSATMAKKLFVLFIFSFFNNYDRFSRFQAQNYRTIIVLSYIWQHCL